MYDVKPLRIVVTGASGFIGSHLARELKRQGHHVVGVDWRMPNEESIQIEDSCHEFLRADLRSYKECLRATAGAAHVFHLAADVGGQGFSTSNRDACLVNNALIDLQILEACRQNGIARVFFASSASDPGLAEEGFRRYADGEFRMECRVARFPNVYGPGSSWIGGRERAPAALCRKVAANTGGDLEVWGDGRQRRSFVYVDDLVEGVLRLMACGDPRVRGRTVTIGSDTVCVDDLAWVILDIAGRNDVRIRHAPGPVGVHDQKPSDDLMRSVLGWEPRVGLRDGMERLYDWVAEQVYKADDPSGYSMSYVVPLSVRPMPV